MLSASHHVCFWLLAGGSVLVRQLYGLVQGSLGDGWDQPVLLLQWAIGALPFHYYLGLFEEAVPAAEHARWRRRRRLRRRGWGARLGNVARACGRAALARRNGVFYLGIGTMCVFVLDGATAGGLLPTDGTMTGGRKSLAHLLASFMVLGTLESMRQDRLEMEASGLFLWHREVYGETAVRDGFRAWRTTVGIIAVLSALVSLVGYLKTGTWISFLDWWFPGELSAKHTWTMLWLLSPICDMVETGYYLVYRRQAPDDYQHHLDYICDRSWLWWVGNRLVLLCWWAGVMGLAWLLDETQGAVGAMLGLRWRSEGGGWAL